MKPRFKETRKFLNSIHTINYGGCGISALALYDSAKREGLKPKIVYLYHALWESESMERNDQFKKGERKKADACSHVLVKIGNRLYDSTGFIPKSMIWAYAMDEKITRDHLIASINNKGVWNDVFERKRFMPQIQKYLKRGTTIKV